jgi:hypothetical protein
MSGLVRKAVPVEEGWAVWVKPEHKTAYYAHSAARNAYCYEDKLQALLRAETLRKLPWVEAAEVHQVKLVAVRIDGE